MDARRLAAEDYRDWKGWSEVRDPDPLVAEGYALDLARAGVEPGARLLELGFGGGGFLRWAREQGYAVAGFELDDELARRAQEAGFEATSGDLDALRAGWERGGFDAVVAFDVLEHLEPDPLVETLGALRELLRPGGVIVARVPNGGSPFGRYYQHGDVTHKTALTSSLCEQLGRLAGLELVRFDNAARPWRRGRRRLLRLLSYGSRTLIERAVGYLYFHERLPLDPNAVVVWRACGSSG